MQVQLCPVICGGNRGSVGAGEGRLGKDDQVVGTIDFQLGGKTIEQRPLVVMQDVPEGGFFSRMIDFVMMKFNGWFGKWFS